MTSYLVIGCLGKARDSLPPGSVVKSLPAMQEMWVPSPGWGRSSGGGHGNPLQYSWGIPWTVEPGGLQSVGSQRVGHDRAHTGTASGTQEEAESPVRLRDDLSLQGSATCSGSPQTQPSD